MYMYCCVTIALCILFFSIGVLGSAVAMRDEAVKNDVGEYFIDIRNRKQFRWKR